MSVKECIDHKDKKQKTIRRVCAGILIFLFIILLTILLIWAILQPKKPRFILQDATIFNFNVSAPNIFSTSIQVTIFSRNPNDNIGVYYEKMHVYANYHNQQITYYTQIPSVYQGHKDVNIWSPYVSSNNVPIAPYNGPDLEQDQQNGGVWLDFKIDGRVKWKVGTFTSGHYHLHVRCPAYVPFGNNPGDGGIVVGNNAVKYQLARSCDLQVEFGSSYLHAPVINELSHDQKDVQFQNGTNAFDIDEYFNSVLDSSDELSYEDSGLELRTVQFASNSINTITTSPVKDFGLCSESKAQVMQEPVGTDLFEPEVLWGDSVQTAPVRVINSIATTVEEAFATPIVNNDHSTGNLDFLNNDYPGDAALSAGSGGMQVPYLLNVEDSSAYRTVGSDSGFGTGIKLRTRLKQNQPDDKQFGSGMQGTSYRRIRFQMKLQAGSVQCRVPIDSDKGGANYKGLLTVSESDKFSIEDSSTAGAAISNDKTQDTMCKEVKGYGLVAEDPSANAQDTDDFSVDEASKTAALSSFSSSFYISMALVAVSIIIVFLGFLGICFKLR